MLRYKCRSFSKINSADEALLLQLLWKLSEETDVMKQKIIIINIKIVVWGA